MPGIASLAGSDADDAHQTVWPLTPFPHFPITHQRQLHYVYISSISSTLNHACLPITDVTALGT